MTKSEKLAITILRNDGYQVEHAIPTMYHRTDLFGSWDIIAVNSKEIRFIQVSSKYMSQRSPQDQRSMQDFIVPKNCTKEYWHWKQKEREFDIVIL